MEEQDLPLAILAAKDTGKAEGSSGDWFAIADGLGLNQAGGDSDIALHVPAELGSGVAFEDENAALDVLEKLLLGLRGTEDVVVDMRVGEQLLEDGKILILISLSELGVQRGELLCDRVVILPILCGRLGSSSKGKEREEGRK